jgi:hypothetical protein
MAETETYTRYKLDIVPIDTKITNNSVKLKELNKISIGSIEYNLDNDDDGSYIVKINFLDVNKDNQGQGIGSKLLILMFAVLLPNKKIKQFTLDDCSDLALTKNSIYYKFRFRISNASNPEVMNIFLEPSKKPITSQFTYNQTHNQNQTKIYKTLLDYLETIKKQDFTEFSTQYKIMKTTVVNDQPQIIEPDITQELLRRLKSLNIIEYHPRACKRQRLSGGAKLKKTDEKVKTKNGPRVVYIVGKKKYIKYGGSIVSTNQTHIYL